MKNNPNWAQGLEIASGSKIDFIWSLQIIYETIKLIT